MENIIKRNLLIIGDHNVGKKTLKNYITTNNPELYGEIYIGLENKDKDITNVIIMMNTEYKSTSSKSVKSYIDAIYSIKSNVIICGNKSDLIDNCFQDTDEFNELINKYMIPYVETSLINDHCSHEMDLIFNN